MWRKAILTAILLLFFYSAFATSQTPIITTIAGTGAANYNGDNILAVNAELYYPSRMFVSSIGEIFFADFGNHRIRKILTNGTIISLAGTGTPGYNGDNILAVNAQLHYPSSTSVLSTGEVLLTDAKNNRIRYVKSI